jgi:zeta-carotene isomerase
MEAVHGEDFRRIQARTSVLPFAAVLEGRQVLPPDYWKELLRAPLVLIAAGTVGAYLAHPYMQAGAALVRSSGLSPGGILDPLFLELN